MSGDDYFNVAVILLVVGFALATFSAWGLVLLLMGSILAALSILTEIHL